MVYLLKNNIKKNLAPLNRGIIGCGKIAHDFVNDLALVQPPKHLAMT